MNIAFNGSFVCSLANTKGTNFGKVGLCVALGTCANYADKLNEYGFKV